MPQHVSCYYENFLKSTNFKRTCSWVLHTNFEKSLIIVRSIIFKSLFNSYLRKKRLGEGFYQRTNQETWIIIIIIIVVIIIIIRRRTNHIKARIDKTQQNSKCRLCGDRDETINYIISECSKLVQKEYKTRHDWVGKVIHWERSK